MAKVDVQTLAGKKAGTADLDDAIFGIEPIFRSCTRS